MEANTWGIDRRWMRGECIKENTLERPWEEASGSHWVHVYPNHFSLTKAIWGLAFSLLNLFPLLLLCPSKYFWEDEAQTQLVPEDQALRVIALSEAFWYLGFLSGGLLRLLISSWGSFQNRYHFSGQSISNRSELSHGKVWAGEEQWLPFSGTGKIAVSPEVGGRCRRSTQGAKIDSCPPLLEVSGVIGRSPGHTDRALSARGSFSEKKKGNSICTTKIANQFSLLSAARPAVCVVWLWQGNWWASRKPKQERWEKDARRWEKLKNSTSGNENEQK